ECPVRAPTGPDTVAFTCHPGWVRYGYATLCERSPTATYSTQDHEGGEQQCGARAYRVTDQLPASARPPEDRLQLEKLLEARLAPLAAVARLLVATEAGPEIRTGPVHVDVA